MKQVHNVRLRATGRTRDAVDAILARGDAMARRKETDIVKRTVVESDGLWSGELWIDHQQPVRKFVQTLIDELGPQTETIATQPSKFLDVGTHCFIHLARGPFLEGKSELSSGGETVAIRLNIASFPATREGALVTLRALFAREVNP